MKTDTPTTSDLATLAKEISAEYLQIKGLAPRPTPMLCKVDGNISVADFERRLKLAGLEMYPAADGANFIRTVESGNRHRQIVEAERLARLAEAQATAEFLRCVNPGSRIDPPEFVRKLADDSDYE